MILSLYALKEPELAGEKHLTYICYDCATPVLIQVKSRQQHNQIFLAAFFSGRQE